MTRRSRDRGQEHWLMIAVETCWVGAGTTWRVYLGVFNHIGIIFLLCTIPMLASTLKVAHNGCFAYLVARDDSGRRV